MEAGDTERAGTERGGGVEERGGCWRWALCTDALGRCESDDDEGGDEMKSNDKSRASLFPKQVL